MTNKIDFEVSTQNHQNFDISAEYVGWDVRKFKRGMGAIRYDVMKVYQEEKGLSKADQKFLENLYPREGALLRVGLTKISTGEKYLADGYMIKDAGQVTWVAEPPRPPTMTPMVIEVVHILRISVIDDEADEDDVSDGEPYDGLVVRRTSYLTMLFPQGLTIKLEPENVVEQLAPALLWTTEVVRP